MTRNRTAGTAGNRPSGASRLIEPMLAGRTRAGTVTREAIIDGAWALLQDEGVAGVSTRKIAARAGVNQALVHYHFGSMDQLMVEVLERIAVQVMGRNRQRYAGDRPFVDKYRADMADLLNDDLRNGWGKVWLEAIALALNSPELLEPFFAQQRTPARRSLENEVLQAMGETSKDARRDAEGMAALVYLLRAGLVIDRLTGTSRGHARAVELLGEFLSERIGGSEGAPSPAAAAKKAAAKKAAAKKAPAKPTATKKAAASTKAATSAATRRSAAR